MILGCGTAKTYEAIVAEYDQFLHDTGRDTSSILERLKDAPHVIQRRIGKPFDEWTDEDVIGLYQDRQKATCQPYNAFLAFLFFRDYYRPTLHLLATLPVYLSRHHRQALAPHREKLKQAQEQLHYASSSTGSELKLLIWLLAVMGKPLEQLTRADFDAFRDEYQAWYRKNRCADGSPDHRLFRLQRYLVHWGVIPEARVVFRHEEHFARLRHEPIRQAILVHMQWCDAKYKPSTIHSRRASLLHFFLWFQDRYPDSSCLDEVTRSVVLEYGQYLKARVEDGTYSSRYRNNLYRGVRLLFDFVIDERLSTSPDRNPFDRRDMPLTPDPVPRYLSDHELRVVLEYCHNGATTKERTVVTTLLHTGIRAAELAALQVHDIVQVQGKWKLHIREGKGLKDRVIPLTAQCLAVLRAWQEDGWEQINSYLFTRYGRPWHGGANARTIVREIGRTSGIERLTPHRFRHTFAVALLNYGIRESVLQKLMGHSTLNMTLEYARILDRTVEQAFNQAVEQMQVGPLSWVPSFFAPEDYTLFAKGDAVNWIRLPHGYCRRHHKLHCESDVKCLLCDRFCALPSDLPRLQEMYNRFLGLGMQVKADVVASHLRRLEAGTDELSALEVIGLQYPAVLAKGASFDEVELLTVGACA
jgi:site-specific recombinase XerD